MIAKQDTPEPVDGRGTANTKDPLLDKSLLRKRAMAIFVLVLGAVILTMCCFYQAKLVENGGRGIWSGFWVATIFISLWLVFRIVQIFRKTPKSWHDCP